MLSHSLDLLILVNGLESLRVHTGWQARQAVILQTLQLHANQIARGIAVLPRWTMDTAPAPPRPRLPLSAARVAGSIMLSSVTERQVSDCSCARSDKLDACVDTPGLSLLSHIQSRSIGPSGGASEHLDHVMHSGWVCCHMSQQCFRSAFLYGPCNAQAVLQHKFESVPCIQSRRLPDRPCRPSSSSRRWNRAAPCTAQGSWR